jgi:hypothetical protein
MKPVSRRHTCTSAAVIEVDDFDRPSSIRDWPSADRNDEAETFIVLPIGFEALAEIDRTAKEFCLCRVDHAVTPAPPMGLASPRLFQIPGVPLEPAAVSLPRMQMHAGRDFAKHLGFDRSCRCRPPSPFHWTGNMAGFCTPGETG